MKRSDLIQDKLGLRKLLYGTVQFKVRDEIYYRILTPVWEQKFIVVMGAQKIHEK
jgi:hypothetical protein